MILPDAMVKKNSGNSRVFLFVFGGVLVKIAKSILITNLVESNISGVDL